MWFRVDDSLVTHPKWISTPPRARGLWITAGSWCAGQLNDGYVPRNVLRVLGANTADATALVNAGLWEPVEGGGWKFHDWHDYQPSAEEVQVKREKRAAAGRRGGIKSGESRRSKGEANASANAEQDGSKIEPRTRTRTPTTTRPTVSGRSAAPRRGRSGPVGDDEQTLPGTAPPAPAPVPEPTPAPAPGGPTAQNLINGWIRSCPRRPPSTVIAQVGRHLKTLLAEGWDPDALAQALTHWQQRGMHPSALPSVANELANATAGATRPRGTAAQVHAEGLQRGREIHRAMTAAGTDPLTLLASTGDGIRLPDFMRTPA